MEAGFVGVLVVPVFDMESPIPFRAVLVSKGSDVVAIGAIGFDLAAEQSDLGATAELEAGFVGVLVSEFAGVLVGKGSEHSD